MACVQRGNSTSGAPLQNTKQASPWRHSTLIILRALSNSHAARRGYDSRQ